MQIKQKLRNSLVDDMDNKPPSQKQNVSNIILIYQELKRSQKDRHIQTHGNCIEIFRLAWPSFSIGRE